MRTLALAFILITMTGCSRTNETSPSTELPTVKSSFHPPSEDQLANVDSADCEYGKTVVEIEGVVSPSSQGGWPHSDDYDVHCFSLSAWRYPGKPIVNTELTVLRPVDSGGDWFSEYPKLSLHRIRVLLSVDKTRAVFAGKFNETPDRTLLEEIAEELSKPVVINTQRFGDLTLDRSIDWFEGEVNWNGETIRINFHTDGNHDISAGLKVAEKLWGNQEEWKQKVDDYAVKELLPLKNGTWLGEDESPFSAEKFKSRMTLQSISIYPDGLIEFWHDDGDLFWGHSIQISGSIEEGLNRADIPG